MTTTKGFKYLGINVTPELKDIIPTNYDPLIERTAEMLDRWSALPISMIGRINLIKMTVLPQYLYYFQTLPLPLPITFYDKLNKLFCRFIWNSRRARLRLKLLHLPYERGGLKLPNLRWYYMAAQLASASYYFCSTKPPAWVSIEQESILGLPLNLYLYSSNIGALRKHTKNPFLRNTILVWHSACKHLNCIPMISQFTPIWGNEQFTPGNKDGGFRLWNKKGVQKIMDHYQDGVLLCFDALCQKYQLPKTNNKHKV